MFKAIKNWFSDFFKMVNQRKTSNIYKVRTLIRQMIGAQERMNAQMGGLIDLSRDVYQENIDRHLEFEEKFKSLSENVNNRREEISSLMEIIQNLDNHDVIMDINKRLSDLEKRNNS